MDYKVPPTSIYEEEAPWINDVEGIFIPYDPIARILPSLRSTNPKSEIDNEID